MATWRMKLGDTLYDFRPEKDFSTDDWKQMGRAYGADFSSWDTFKERMFNGNHRVALCLIWGARRKAGEKVPDDPRRLELPADFSVGAFFDGLRNVEMLHALEDFAAAVAQ